MSTIGDEFTLAPVSFNLVDHVLDKTERNALLIYNSLSKLAMNDAEAIRLILAVWPTTQNIRNVPSILLPGPRGILVLSDVKPNALNAPFVDAGLLGIDSWDDDLCEPI